MKKTKKFIRFLFILSVIIVSATLIGSITYYNIITHGISLETEKLQLQKTSQSLNIYDAELNKIKPTKASYINLSKLSSDTKNSFICAEDKRFYKHNGLDYIRIAGAIMSNIKSKSFSQGASTISQQLVKNTQLTNEKTISRKLKEFKLTKELEKIYSKDEIFELYLNNIYFGNGCYGVENASRHYFSKPASELTLSESTLLAGVINAPTYYNIETNLNNAIKRRNLILSLMKKDNKISEEAYNKAINEPVNLNISDISGNSSLYKNILNEACEVLNIDEITLNNSNYKIYTSINNNLNENIKLISNNYKSDSEIATIVINNKNHLITAINGKSKILENKWQPGSTIKPILVYAPAIEKEIITPSTSLLDNKINISGYSPENYDKKYHGYISAKTALSKSYNIPAVKLLNELGIAEAKNFASKLGIEFTESDNHLALALGGFEEGITAKSLCDAYSSFACEGKFSESKYIKKITKNGKTIYENNPTENQVMKETTAIMINEMLEECAKTGTAKNLSSLPFSVCSKTGTVGKFNSSKNKLAYNISYTPEHTIITLIQGENLPEKINGATTPTIINKEILLSIYKNQKPAKFKFYENNNQKNITKTESKLNQAEATTDKQKTDKSSNIFTNSLELKAINSQNHNPILCFMINENCEYFLIRTHKNKEEIIFSSSENSNKFIKYTDKTAKSNQMYIN